MKKHEIKLSTINRMTSVNKTEVIGYLHKVETKPKIDQDGNKSYGRTRVDYFSLALDGILSDEEILAELKKAAKNKYGKIRWIDEV